MQCVRLQGVLQNVRFVFGTTLEAILRNKGCQSCKCELQNINVLFAFNVGITVYGICYPMLVNCTNLNAFH